MIGLTIFIIKPRLGGDFFQSDFITHKAYSVNTTLTLFNACLRQFHRFRLTCDFNRSLTAILTFALSQFIFINCVYCTISLLARILLIFKFLRRSYISNLPFNCLTSQFFPKNPSGHKHWKVVGVKLRQVALFEQGLDEQLFYKKK